MRAGGLILCYVLLLAYIIKKFLPIQDQRKFKQQETNQLREMDEFKSQVSSPTSPMSSAHPLTVILGKGSIGQRTKRPKPGKKKLSSSNEMATTSCDSSIKFWTLSKLESQTLQLNYTQGDVLALFEIYNREFTFRWPMPKTCS